MAVASQNMVSSCLSTCQRVGAWDTFFRPSALVHTSVETNRTNRNGVKCIEWSVVFGGSGHMEEGGEAGGVVPSRLAREGAVCSRFCPICFALFFFETDGGGRKGKGVGRGRGDRCNFSSCDEWNEAGLLHHRRHAAFHLAVYSATKPAVRACHAA